jgi:hypothetical protein
VQNSNPGKGEPEKLATFHFLDAKLLKQGKEELPASAFLFKMLTNCKDPWMVKE